MSKELLDPEQVLRIAAQALRDKLPPTVRLHVECERSVRSVHGSLKAFVNSLVCPTLMVARAMREDGHLNILIRNCDVDKSFAALYNDLKPGAYVEAILTATPVARRLADLVPGLNRTVSPEGGCFVVHPGEDGIEALLCFWPAAAAERAVTEPEKGGGELILVIDDEPSVLLLLVNALQLAGYRTLAARDGATALDLLSRYDGEVALVMTDIMMPGINGHEVMQAVAARHASTKTLAISGFVSKEAIEQVQASGASAFLAKPFQLKRLLHTVHTLLHGSEAPSSTRSITPRRPQSA